jgi:large subunit ribosomal protein L24
MNKIRKGDDVVVTTGKDKGKRGVVLSAVVRAPACRRRQPRQEAHQAQSHEGQSGRHCREGNADQYFQRGAVQSGHPEGGPRRLQNARRRPQGRVFKSNGEVVDA